MSGYWIPVIRVNYSGISGECLETARNSPFLWRQSKDGNAATSDIPVLQAVLTLSATTCHSTDTENPADAVFLRA
jgi:hypothetical protein